MLEEGLYWTLKPIIKAIIKKILSINVKEAKQKKVSKSTLWEMKERLNKDPKNFNWKTKAVRKLLF